MDLKMPFLTLLVIALAACSQQADEVVIGVAVPLTGPASLYGEQIRDATDMAIEDINAAGGVDGRMLRAVYEDTKCDSNQAIASFKKLAEIDDVAAIIGPFCGSENMVAGPFSTESKTVIVSPGDNFGHIGEYMINTRYKLDDEAELLAGYINGNNWTRVALLYFNNDWGQRYHDIITRDVTAAGGRIVAVETFDYANIDRRTQLTKIKEADPDVLFLMDGTGGEGFKQAYELGLDMPMLDDWEIANPEWIANAGPAVEGVVFFLPLTERTSFHDRFAARYGNDPNTMQVDAYDAVTLATKAIGECGDDPDCMIESISSVSGYPGVGGPLTFDRDKWAFTREFQRMRIEDGKAVPYD